MSPPKVTAKRYRCQRCGHETTQRTNHYGQTYSVGRFNSCPACPPWAKFPEFGGGTVWECCETPPLGEKIPANWTPGVIVVKP